MMLNKNILKWKSFTSKHGIVKLGQNKDVIQIIHFLEESIYLEIETYLASNYPETAYEKFTFEFEKNIKNKERTLYPRIQDYATYKELISFLLHWCFSRQEFYGVNFERLIHFRIFLNRKNFIEHLKNYNNSRKLFPETWVTDISLFLKNMPMMLQKIIDQQSNDFFSISCSENVFKRIISLLKGTFIQFHVFQPEDSAVDIQSDYSKLVFIAHLSNLKELEILEKLLATTNKELECIFIRPFAFEGRRSNNKAKVFLDELDIRQIKYKLIESMADNKPFQEVFELQYKELIQLIKQVS